jgi:hypothetical protein
MRVSEFYAMCLAATVLALVWALLGVPGVLCCISAMIVGNIDVAWIDDFLEKRNAEPDTAAPAPPPTRVFAVDVRVPVVDVGAPSPLKPRRAKIVKKLAPNVVQFPRKVS